MKAAILFPLLFAIAACASPGNKVPSNTLCVYPLSPSYSLLQRAQIYLLVLFVLLNPLKTPLFHGALAALMTKVSIIAIHAIVLLPPLVKGDTIALDLDIVGTWSVISLTSCCLAVLLSWSTALKGSKAKPLVRIWGFLVAIATVCSYAGLRRMKALRFADGSNGVCGGISNGYLRPGEHPVAIATERVFDKRFEDDVRILAPFVLIATIVGLWACFRPSPQPPLKETAMDLYSGDVLPRSTGPSPSLKSGPFRKALLMLLTLSPSVVLIAQLVQQELYFVKDGALPTMEQPQAVGQWGSWVGACLVLVAALIGKALEEKEPAKTEPIH